MTIIEQQKAAKEFAEEWKDKGDEKQHCQKFWISLLRDVLGVEKPEKYIDFEKKVKVQNASVYHFGILTSCVHMAWMRAVCGRLETRYCYSIGVVYNNFPWPNPTDEQKSKIEKTAQAILDARSKYPDASLADMYGSDMYLFPDLCKAHEANDKAVMQAYGFRQNLEETEIVEELFKMYERLAKESS